MHDHIFGRSLSKHCEANVSTSSSSKVLWKTLSLTVKSCEKSSTSTDVSFLMPPPGKSLDTNQKGESRNGDHTKKKQSKSRVKPTHTSTSARLSGKAFHAVKCGKVLYMNSWHIHEQARETHSSETAGYTLRHRSENTTKRRKTTVITSLLDRASSRRQPQ